MFAAVLRELGFRRIASERFTHAIAAMEHISPEIAIQLKGFAFIQMYATYEFTVRSSVQATLASLKSSNTPATGVRQETLSLVLDSCWSSAANAGLARLWECRIDLLERVRSAMPADDFQDTLFPTDGSHFRIRQLRTIWRVFGVNAPVVPDLRLQGRIEEIVENRNAVAHGRRTAEDVGRDYSHLDIVERFIDLNNICQHVLVTLETHYNNGGLLT